MIAFKGVRSSCDMLARNCDFNWLATSSCLPLSSISRNKRAFWTASTDWPDEDCSSATCRRASPATLRRITSAPITRSSRNSGTASTRAHALVQQRPAHPAVFLLLHVRHLVGRRLTAHAHRGFPRRICDLVQYPDISVVTR
ncbi:MAG: hypothetical protein IPI73_26250 [Betaproteobacteria bacterium]|nr:hypothetical protein [Betaproteobacteria bacterium]